MTLTHDFTDSFYLYASRSILLLFSLTFGIVDEKMLQEIQIVPDNVWKIDWLVEVVRRASDNFEKGLSVTQTDMKTPWRKRKVRQLLYVLCRV